MAVICEFEFNNINSGNVMEFEPILRQDGRLVFYGRVSGTSLFVYQEFRDAEDEVPTGVPFYQEVEWQNADGGYKIVAEMERDLVFKTLSGEEAKFALWDDLLPKSITYFQSS